MLIGSGQTYDHDMLLKIIIVILFFANVVALSGALYTLLVDQGKSNRTGNLLLIRVSLAALLVLALVYGVWSGQLGVAAPWHTS
jgi:membrane-anchored protein YejM (alkaline phosphatase superfamily)